MTDLTEKGLGYSWIYDPRAAAYPMRSFLTSEELAEAPTSKVWRHGSILDQGREGACVAFGWAAWKNCEPVPGSLTNADAMSVYNRARQIDEWPGEDYSGTSNQAGAKVMRERGYLETFAWAGNPEDMKAWLLTRGPVTFTCQWRSGMYRTDSGGFLQFAGDVVGGHLMCCIGFDGQNYVVQNSWSERFGKNGICYVTPEVMAKLYAAGQWTACTAVEIGAPPKPDRFDLSISAFCETDTRTLLGKRGRIKSRYGGGWDLEPIK